MYGSSLLHLCRCSDKEIEKVYIDEWAKVSQCISNLSKYTYNKIINLPTTVLFYWDTNINKL